MSNIDSKELEETAMPLFEYLLKKHHPHFTAIVSCNHVELTEGLINIRYQDFIKPSFEQVFKDMGESPY